jgi:drug/metabolite transporter (DMT)-like permease
VDVIALGAAIASATGFAASTSLQHHAAGSAPEGTNGLGAFVRYLLATPTWLVGQFLALMSFFLHAVALHFGPLALVQPIVVSGVVIAVPARSALSRRWPSTAELAAVSVATLGLAVFLVASDPSTGHNADPGWGPFLFTVAGMTVAGLAVWASVLLARMRRPRRAAAMLGVSAGIFFGVVAGLVKLTIGVWVDEGAVHMLATWPLYFLLVCGAGGILSNQRAYTLAGLSASLPMLNIVNVVVALFFGLLVFEEVPAHGALALTLEITALATVMFGLLMVARVEEVDTVDVQGRV